MSARCRDLRFLGGRFGHFLSTQGLAIGAITADFRACAHNLKSQAGLHLAANSLNRLTEELIHFAATEANHVGVFLFELGFVVVLVALEVHQIEFVHQAAFLRVRARPHAASRDLLHAFERQLASLGDLLREVGIDRIELLNGRQAFAATDGEQCAFGDQRPSDAAGDRRA